MDHQFSFIGEGIYPMFLEDKFCGSELDLEDFQDFVYGKVRFAQRHS